MSAITPEGIIKLYSGIPFDNSYRNTVYFPSLSAQVNYFHTGTPFNVQVFDRQMYQRAEKNKLRIQAKADKLFVCNYLAFNNGIDYKDKWFYGFITKVEYINENVTEITYELDVLQTYFFDFTMKQCFVEREHSETDNFGDNLIQEDLSIGDDYVSNQYPLQEALFPPTNLGLVATKRHYEGDDKPVISDKMFCGLACLLNGSVSLDTNRGQEFRNIYSSYTDKDEIINIFQYPNICIKTPPNLGDYTFYLNGQEGNNLTVSVTPSLQNIDGYVPVNKKLFTYPYNFLLFSNYSGQSTKLKYELFKTTEGKIISQSDTINFYAEGTILPKPTVSCYPMRYRNIVRDYENMLVIKDLPECAFPSDIYKAYCAQNKASTTWSVIGGIISTGLGAASLIASAGASGGASVPAIIGGVGAVAGGVASVGRTVGHYSDIKANPDHAIGQQNAEGIKSKNGKYGYAFYKMCIHSEQAKVIDDYFTMFGYATNTVKIPNIKKPNARLRPRFNYIKTNGCNIIGRLPADDCKKICDIFDTGITFWNTGVTVGDYGGDNRPR